MREDMLLIARFYLRKRVERPHLATMEDVAMATGDNQTNMYDDETLVGWSVIPLLVPRLRSKFSRS